MPPAAPKFPERRAAAFYRPVFMLIFKRKIDVHRPFFMDKE
jgi:hypothetical protein